MNGEARLAVAGCGACGSNQIVIDEVIHQGRMLLGECQHCSYRWTRTLAGPAVVAGRHRSVARAGRRIGTELAAAA